MEDLRLEIQESYEHEIYKNVDITEADAVAWAFVSPQKFVQFPFKFPEIASGELRVNVLYAGLCLSDSLHSRSRWGIANYPTVPGHEIIAEVSQIGSEVSDFKVGDKVAFGTMRSVCENCKYCKVGKEPLCSGIDGEDKFTYGKYFGGYATQMQQPANFFFKLPEGLDLKLSSPLLCAGITVYTPIKRYLKSGDVTAVVGIGGLGHLAVQFLAKMGHHVTAITSSDSKKEFILNSLGATDVLISTDNKAMNANSGKYDFIISTSPSVENFSQLFDLLAPGGTYVLVGNGDVGQTVNVMTMPLVTQERKLVGSLVGNREDIREMLELCAQKQIYPIVEEFSFEDFPKALDRLENGKPVFRCVVNTGEYSKKNNLFK